MGYYFARDSLKTNPMQNNNNKQDTRDEYLLFLIVMKKIIVYSVCVLKHHIIVNLFIDTKCTLNLKVSATIIL